MVVNFLLISLPKKILILGAGFGGLAAANLLRSKLDSSHQIVVIDRKAWFMMGLVKLWILEGTRGLEDSKTSLRALASRGIEYLCDEITSIDPSSKSVETANHGTFTADYMIVALGAELAPELVSGFSGTGYNLYNAPELPKLRERLLSLKSGHVAITIMGAPYKCPPAPFEACMIIDELLRKNNTRDSTSIAVYSPAPIALPVAGPKISESVTEMLSKRGIEFHASSKPKAVSGNRLEFDNGTGVEFAVLIGIPQHVPPQVIKESKLASGTPAGWIAVNRETLQTDFEGVYAIGDATEIKVSPTIALPKAGIFAEEEAKIVSARILNEINPDEYRDKPSFLGKGFCFMETGTGQAGYLEADFFGQQNPVLKLELPSHQNLEKKREFERSRLSEWLL